LAEPTTEGDPMKLANQRASSARRSAQPIQPGTRWRWCVDHTMIGTQLSPWS
jgi:hypothetical protein